MGEDELLNIYRSTVPDILRKWQRLEMEISKEFLI